MCVCVCVPLVRANNYYPILLRDGRRGQEDDTLSLFGVGGEREEGAGIRRRQDGRISQRDTSESSTRSKGEGDGKIYLHEFFLNDLRF